MKYPYIINNNKVVIYDKAKSYIVDSDDERYSELVDAIKENNEEMIQLFIDNENKVNETLVDSLKLSENIVFKDGNIFYKNESINNTISKKIVQMINDGYKDMMPIINFMENLMQNPSKRAVDELYGFLDYANLPITPDGHFIAYKKVRSDFKDIYTGKFDNSVGQECSMPRNFVDDDKEKTCSKGLHFCAKEYLQHFGTEPSNRVVLLKINPKDVVSIPVDYNNTKGRCCFYKIIDTYEDDTLLENFSLYFDDEDCEYDDDCFDNEDDENDENDYEEEIDHDGEEFDEDSDKEISDEKNNLENCKFCGNRILECICDGNVNEVCVECDEFKYNCRCTEEDELNNIQSNTNENNSDTIDDTVDISIKIITKNNEVFEFKKETILNVVKDRDTFLDTFLNVLEKKKPVICPVCRQEIDKDIGICYYCEMISD